MNTIPAQPCAHAACGCKVQDAGDYCCDACRSRQDAPDCQCGHSDCVVEAAMRRAEKD